MNGWAGAAILNTRRHLVARQALQLGVAGRLLVRDSFTGVDGTLLSAHSPEVGPGSWLNNTNSFEIQSNQLELNYTLGARRAVIDAGVADGTLQADLSLSDGALTDRTGLIFRWTGAGDHWMFNFHDPSSGLVYLYEINLGVWTLRGFASFPFQQDRYYRFKVVLKGMLMHCYLDGGLVISYSSTFNQSATRHGFYAVAKNGSPTHLTRIDNFEVWA